MVLSRAWEAVGGGRGTVVWEKVEGVDGVGWMMGSVRGLWARSHCLVDWGVGGILEVVMGWWMERDVEGDGGECCEGVWAIVYMGWWRGLGIWR